MAIIEMECPVCLEIFNEAPNRPRLLGCGHTFCEECLNQLISDTQIMCPTCRNISVSLSPSSLPTVLDLIANEREDKQASSKPRLSEQCGVHPEEAIIHESIEDAIEVYPEGILNHGGHKSVELDDPVLELRIEFTDLLGTVEELVRANDLKKEEVIEKREEILMSVEKELEKIDTCFAKIHEKLNERKYG